jgi:hypothetical protein
MNKEIRRQRASRSTVAFGLPILIGGVLGMGYEIREDDIKAALITTQVNQQYCPTINLTEFRAHHDRLEQISREGFAQNSEYLTREAQKSEFKAGVECLKKESEMRKTHLYQGGSIFPKMAALGLFITIIGLIPRERYD